MKRLLIFLATYNEVDNIRDLIRDIHEVLPYADVLVVDDNSPDGTGRVVDELARADGRVRVIHRRTRLGLGTAHKLAMKIAFAEDYDAVITMDADFSHHPKYLPEFIRLLSNHEFVIGSRFVAGGQCDYSFLRLLLSRGANILGRVLLGIRLHETTTSYRGFSRSLLAKLDVDQIRADGYSFFVEAVYEVSRTTASLVEFPIRFEDRRAGSSKISRKEVYKGVGTLLRLVSRRIFAFKKRSRRPGEHGEVEIPCGLCHSRYHVEIYANQATFHQSGKYSCTSNEHSSHGRIVQCLECGVVYTNPQISPSDLLVIYSDVEDRTYLDQLSARAETFRYNLDRIKSLLPSRGRLLDVGSYCGVFLNVARAAGYAVLGVEPSRWASEYAKREFGVETILGTLSDVGEGAGFDIVTSWDVLEHVSDPQRQLQEMNRVLKPGGLLAFSTLNIANWYPSLLRERWPWLMDMHLYYFDDALVEWMLKRAGFRLIEARDYCHIITVEYFLWKLSSLGIPGLGWLRSVISKTPLRRSFIPFRFGDIRLYVCQKAEVT